MGLTRERLNEKTHASPRRVRARRSGCGLAAQAGLGQHLTMTDPSSGGVINWAVAIAHLIIPPLLDPVIAKF